MIVKDPKKPLLGYLSGILRKNGGMALANSEINNHIHLLANVPTDLSISELIRQIKSSTSKWYREDDLQSFFAWNEGYSAFTVSPASIEKVKQYLLTEEDRHSKISFEDELIKLLNIQEIDFKQKYLTTTTYTKLFYHLVWSVKSRKSLLHPSFQGVLHEHMHQQLLKNQGKLHAVGSVVDHIHLLVECPANCTMAHLIQNLKTTSSHLIKSQSNMFKDFNWQEGYGIFSVGKSAFDPVCNYVKNQEDHHKQKSFEDEWNELKHMILIG